MINLAPIDKNLPASVESKSDNRSAINTRSLRRKSISKHVSNYWLFKIHATYVVFCQQVLQPRLILSAIFLIKIVFGRVIVRKRTLLEIEIFMDMFWMIYESVQEVNGVPGEIRTWKNALYFNCKSSVKPREKNANIQPIWGGRSGAVLGTGIDSTWFRSKRRAPNRLETAWVRSRSSVLNFDRFGRPWFNVTFVEW